MGSQCDVSIALLCRAITNRRSGTIKPIRQIWSNKTAYQTASQIKPANTLTPGYIPFTRSGRSSGLPSLASVRLPVHRTVALGQICQVYSSGGCAGLFGRLIVRSVSQRHRTSRFTLAHRLHTREPGSKRVIYLKTQVTGKKKIF